MRVRLPVSIAEDLHVQSAQTRTEKQTRTRESNRANVWLQTVHEQKDQQQITFTHKCLIIKYNVHSFNVSFPRTVPGSPLRLSHSQCNPSPSLSLSTCLTHMKYLHWTIRRPSSHPVFPHLTIRQSQLSSDVTQSIKSHCEFPVHYTCADSCKSLTEYATCWASLPPIKVR